MSGNVCEICQKAPATVHFKQVIDGAAKEIFVCEGCAKKHGFNIHAPVPGADFLFGIGLQSQTARPSEADKVCPVCHMRSSDLAKTSRLGCEHCYEVFEAELKPILWSMQKSDRHQGKVPVGARVRMLMAERREQLGMAVAAQNFEEAARLRDEIKDLEAQHAASSSLRGASGHGG